MPQTQQEAIAAINQWESQMGGFIENLAQTDWNIQMLTQYVRSHGGTFTVSILNQAVAALRTELQWIGPAPGEAAPKLRGSLAEKLWQMGIGECQHLSHADRQNITQEREKEWKDTQDNVTAIKQSKSLRQELFEAQNLTVQYENGPRCGAINHSKTETQRKAATDRIKQKIRQFNQQHPQHKIDV